MAVYTEVSDTALRDYLDQYDLGELLSCKGIAEGVENSNYLLHLSSGSYILTLYEKRVARDDLPFFVGLMEHLAKRDFTCPLPVHMKSGAVLGELAGRPACIVSFLEGIGVKTPTAEHCRQVGKAMAKLHLTAADFSLTRKNALNPDGWKPLVDANLARADEVEDGMADLIASELAHHQTSWPTDLHVGVIHADLFPDNVFFLGEKLSGVIDFYFGCNDMFAYDLAIGINAWCFDDAFRFRPEFSAAMIAGYQSVRPLEHVEVEAFVTLARGAALRFLLTRLNDWLNVPPGALVVPHDPKPFSARLRHHRAANAPQEYGFA